jgi:hypothetical protein
VENLPVWFLPADIAIFGLMWLSGVPALAALAFLLARRPRRALTWFSTALLCEAILGAALYFILIAVEPDLPPIVLTGLSLLLAGAGQFVAALRTPRTYAVALPFAVAAVVVVVVGIPSIGLSHVPNWRSLPVTLTSLALAAASLIIAVLFPFRSRRARAEGAEGTGLGLSSR